VTKRTRNGFTFIELTVVLVIIATVLLIAVPNLLAWVNASDLGAASRRLAGTIRYVRNQAARRQTSFFLALDLEEHTYRVETRRDPDEVEHATITIERQDPDDDYFKPYEDGFIQRQELPKRIVFDRVVFDDFTEERYGTARIEFRPDGTSQTVAIYLKNTGDLQATVTLNGDTGRVEMYDYDYEPIPKPVLYEQYNLDDE